MSQRTKSNEELWLTGLELLKIIVEVSINISLDFRLLVRCLNVLSDSLIKTVDHQSKYNIEPVSKLANPKPEKLEYIVKRKGKNPRKCRASKFK